MNLAVNNTSLFLAAMLVLVALGISLWQKLGLDRDIVIGVVRAVVQLFIVGYLLKYIFRVNNFWLTLAMMGFIIFNAAWNAKKRGPGIDHALAISLLAIFVSTGVTLGVLVLSGAIKFVPSQMIPISGMIASNSMVAVGLAYRSLNSQFHDQRRIARTVTGDGAGRHPIEVGSPHRRRQALHRRDTRQSHIDDRSADRRRAWADNSKDVVARHHLAGTHRKQHM